MAVGLYHDLAVATVAAALIFGRIRANSLCMAAASALPDDFSPDDGQDWAPANTLAHQGLPALSGNIVNSFPWWCAADRPRYALVPASLLDAG